jgi:hypothetical protein
MTVVTMIAVTTVVMTVVTIAVTTGVMTETVTTIVGMTAATTIVGMTVEGVTTAETTAVTTMTDVGDRETAHVRLVATRNETRRSGTTVVVLMGFAQEGKWGTQQTHLGCQIYLQQLCH